MVKLFHLIISTSLVIIKAIGDLLLGFFCMPVSLIGQILRDFIFGSLMCKIIPYLQGECHRAYCELSVSRRSTLLKIQAQFCNEGQLTFPINVELGWWSIRPRTYCPCNFMFFYHLKNYCYVERFSNFGCLVGWPFELIRHKIASDFDILSKIDNFILYYMWNNLALQKRRQYYC